MFTVRFNDKTLSFDAPVTVYDAAREAELISRDVIVSRVHRSVFSCRRYLR